MQQVMTGLIKNLNQAYTSGPFVRLADCKTCSAIADLIKNIFISHRILTPGELSCPLVRPVDVSCVAPCKHRICHVLGNRDLSPVNATVHARIYCCPVRITGLPLSQFNCCNQNHPVCWRVLLLAIGFLGWNTGTAESLWPGSALIGLIVVGQLIFSSQLAMALGTWSLSRIGLIGGPRRWSFLLIGTSPVLMAFGFWQLNALTAVPQEAVLDAKEFVTPDLEVDKAVWATTDLGAKIPLFKPRDGSEDSLALDGDQGLPQDNTPLPYRAVRLTEPDGSTNCVGWVFADAQRRVLCRYVQQILDDNGYQEVEIPRPGDVAIYRDIHTEIVHVARVTALLHGNRPLIESKWGCHGVFLHLPEGTPYGASCHFYHTGRSNHVLAFSNSGDQGGRNTADALP